MGKALIAVALSVDGYINHQDGLAAESEVRFAGGGVGSGGLGLVDGGEGLDVEAFVIGVTRHCVDVEAFHWRDADTDVGFFVGGDAGWALGARCTWRLQCEKSTD
jgi:hypothetical protein